MDKAFSIPQNTQYPRIQNLYNDILLEYQIRLEKEEKMGRIPPNKSEDIIKRVKQLIKDHSYLLKTSHRNLIKQQQEEKETKEERERRQLENQRKALEHDVKKQQNSEQEDDFEFMKKEQAKKAQIKQVLVETNSEKAEDTTLIKEETTNKQQNTYDDQQTYQQAKKMRNYVHANLDVCLQGIFISNRKKYIAKNQKTKLDLQNVFMKLKNRQIFFKTVACELTTIKTNDIKINQV